MNFAGMSCLNFTKWKDVGSIVGQGYNVNIWMLFVHCQSHYVNLSISSSNDIHEVQVVYMTISDVCSHFPHCASIGNHQNGIVFLCVLFYSVTEGHFYRHCITITGYWLLLVCDVYHMLTKSVYCQMSLACDAAVHKFAALVSRCHQLYKKIDSPSPLLGIC